MATFKLTYLNYRGRAELIRFILSQAGIKFEDIRLAPEKWNEIRPETQLGILPTAEFDGKTLSGNATIARYLAEKHGLAGATPIENAELFSIVECVEDLWLKISSFFWEKDEARQAAAKKQFTESYLPLALKKLESAAALNDSKEGWIKGEEVTYADLAICVLLEVLTTERPSLLDLFPRLGKLKSSVEQLPRIKEWISNRPDTPY